MSSIIAIDESGSTGHSDRYFIIAAVIAEHPRIFNKITPALPMRCDEAKYCKSYPDEITPVMDIISKTDIRIVFVTIDKFSPKYTRIRGAQLYHYAIFELMDLCSNQLIHKDVEIFIDSSPYIGPSELSNNTDAIMKKHGINVKKCIKSNSKQNKCIQVADFIAGSIRDKFEKNKTTNYDTISTKISAASILR